MKITPFIVISSLVLSVLLIHSSALALRCGNVLVSMGDTKAQVTKKCGEPSHIESWEETRPIHGKYYYPYRYSSKYKKHHRPYGHGARETITVEEWTYNFGHTTFIRYLRFEKGRLREITTGDKGY